LVDLGLAKRRLRYLLMNQVYGGDLDVQRTTKRASRSRGSYVYRVTKLGLLVAVSLEPEKPEKRGRK